MFERLLYIIAIPANYQIFTLARFCSGQGSQATFHAEPILPEPV